MASECLRKHGVSVQGCPGINSCIRDTVSQLDPGNQLRQAVESQGIPLGLVVMSACIQIRGRGSATFHGSSSSPDIDGFHAASSRGTDRSYKNPGSKR
jgi:hypothetical protein